MKTKFIANGAAKWSIIPVWIIGIGYRRETALPGQIDKYNAFREEEWYLPFIIIRCTQFFMPLP